MEIYLLRHGIAEVAGAGQSDADRALVPEGEKKLRQVLEVARKAGVKPEVILTSPYRRAVETAEIAASMLSRQAEIEHTDALTPAGSPPAVWKEIRTRRSAAQLLLAGHEPLLGEVCAYLLGAPELLIDFKKGAIIRVDVESLGAQPRGVLRWMLTPRLAAAD